MANYRSFQPVNVAQNYFAGRQFADDEALRGSRNALAQQDVELGQRFNALADNPNAGASDYARIGRSDVANSLTNQQRFSEEQQRQLAGVMVQAAQYGLQSPQPKAFIEQNYPQLAQLAGPEWASLDDNGVKAKLQEAIGVFGPRAGVGPQAAPAKWVSKQGPRGSVIQENPETGEQRQVVGPDNSQPNPNAGMGRTFRDKQSLRKEFDSQPAVKDFKLVLPLYDRATKAPDSRAGDISIIYALGKMFDPGSVVREGELVLAQGAAPWLVQMASGINSQITGDGRLNKDTRAQIMEALNGQVEALRQPYAQERERFSGYADSNGWAPGDVIGPDAMAAFGGGQPPGAAPAAAPQAEVTATGPNGQKIVLRNGQWVPL